MMRKRMLVSAAAVLLVLAGITWVRAPFNIADFVVRSPITLLQEAAARVLQALFHQATQALATAPPYSASRVDPGLQAEAATGSVAASAAAIKAFRYRSRGPQATSNTADQATPALTEGRQPARAVPPGASQPSAGAFLVGGNPLSTGPTAVGESLAPGSGSIFSGTSQPAVPPAGGPPAPGPGGLPLPGGILPSDGLVPPSGLPALGEVLPPTDGLVPPGGVLPPGAPLPPGVFPVGTVLRPGDLPALGTGTSVAGIQSGGGQAPGGVQVPGVQLPGGLPGGVPGGGGGSSGGGGPLPGPELPGLGGLLK